MALVSRFAATTFALILVLSSGSSAFGEVLPSEPDQTALTASDTQTLSAPALAPAVDAGSSLSGALETPLLPSLSDPVGDATPVLPKPESPPAPNPLAEERGVSTPASSGGPADQTQSRSRAGAPALARESQAGRSGRGDAPRAGGGRDEGYAQSGQSRPGNRAPARDERSGSATAGPPIAFGNPPYQGLAQFDRLGRSVDYPAESSLRSFGEEPASELLWAIELLLVMLLIGLGGFVRLARPL